MGTTYTVRLFPANGVPAELKQEIDKELQHVNDLMSNWQKDSEISRFNASRDTAPFPLSPETATVMEAALQVWKLSGGAFDPTIGGLIQIWGFGTKQKVRRPTDEEIGKVKSQSGFDKVALKDGKLTKSMPGITVNLSAIAKGYGVDRVYELLQKKGYSSLLVEIGGEVRVGESRNGKRWKIAVEKPNYEGEREIHRVLELEGLAMATSGDYRNFFEEDGKRYSHILDPRTGFPVEKDVVSATVVGPNCMMVDALATTMLVLGAQAGLELVESLPGYEALLITEKDERTTKGMRQWFAQ